jgi:quinol monooxygenase YgiN
MATVLRFALTARHENILRLIFRPYGKRASIDNNRVQVKLAGIMHGIRTNTARLKEMIIRIFHVEIDPAKRTAFEKGFASLSVGAVKRSSGLISCETGKPTKWTPNSYIVITKWKDAASLEAFAGENWNVPVIPEGMEGFAVNTSVSHYVQMDFP